MGFHNAWNNGRIVVIAANVEITWSIKQIVYDADARICTRSQHRYLIHILYQQNVFVAFESSEKITSEININMYTTYRETSIWTFPFYRYWQISSIYNDYYKHKLDLYMRLCS